MWTVPSLRRHTRNSVKGKMFLASSFLHPLSHQVAGYVYGFDYVAMILLI